MPGQKGAKESLLKIHQRNLELDLGAHKAKPRSRVIEGAEDSIFNIADKEPSQKGIKYGRKVDDGPNNHWSKVSARSRSGNLTLRSRPMSAPKSYFTSTSEQKPTQLAYMSKTGKLSTDMRKYIRPVTAHPCLNKPKERLSQRRPSHSAGHVRFREGNLILGKETKANKDFIGNEEKIRKVVWTSNANLNQDRRPDTPSKNESTVTHSSDLIFRSSAYIRSENDVKRFKTKEQKEEISFGIATDSKSSGTKQGFHKRTQPVLDNMKRTPASSFLSVLLSSNVYQESEKALQVLKQRKEQLRVGTFLEKVQVKDTKVVPEDKFYTSERVAGLFRKSAMFVCSILRLQTYMRDLSATKTSRSATEEQWHAVNTSRQVKELVFNKDIFAKSKAVTRLPVWARMILDKDPDERTERDLRHLHALLRGLKSFDKFAEKIQLAMCRSFTYQWATSGRIILRQGHIGQNFYFIYTGSVFVNIDDTDKDGNQFVKTEVVLKRGQSFGELALLQDIRRTATISCREDCELLVVDKDTFARICPKIFEEELEEKCDFLGTLSMFSPKYWTRDSLKKMCFEARIQEHKTNKLIVSDSAVDQWIYICMEGKASVLRKLDLKKEIEWRKRKRRMINEVKSNLPETDVIDMLGVVEARAYSAGVQRDSKVESTNLEVGKERLLTSMGLEYIKAKRPSVADISEYIDSKRPPKSRSKAERDSNFSEDGPPTLTALIASEKKPNMLFLHIKTVYQNDIFDISSIFCDQDSDTGKGFILASEGCKVLRIQKKSFFKEASDKAIIHAKALAELERYPDDEQLLRNYMEHLTWITYRYSLLDRILQHKGRDHIQMKRRDNEALKTSAKENAKNLELLTELNQAFYEYDPELRRVAEWKQMQEMAARTPKERTVEYTEVISEIRKFGSLIPEIHVNIRENVFKPKEIAGAKELVTSGSLILENEKSDFKQDSNEATIIEGNV